MDESSVTEFETVKQPQGSALCGACVVAMALGETLDAVLELAHSLGLDWRDLTCSRGLVCILGSRGVSLGAYLIPGSDTPAMGNLTLHVNMQSFPALLAVKSDTVAGAEHWALWDGHCVRDPSWRAPDTNRISEYEVLEVWPLVYHIRPAWLDKLDAKDHSLKALHEAIRKRD